MSTNHVLRIIYNQYNTSCPFDLSRKLGIKLEYYDLPKNIYGYCTPINNIQHIIISQSISIELQEKACNYLVTQYILHGTPHLCLDRDTFHDMEHAPKVPSQRASLKNLLYHYTML